MRLAKRIAGWLQEDTAVRQLRRVAEAIFFRDVLFVDMGIEAGIGDAELEVLELQPILDEHIRDTIQRARSGGRHADYEQHENGG